jgi:cellulose biosynthesis protein BcsQ
MKKESKYVAFSTQKGGAGKTTLTVLVASYLHYVKGYSVAVVDCDYPQYSIVEMRERDLQTVMEDEHYKLMAYRQFTSLGRKAYPVVSSTPEDAVQVASQLSETGEFDFVFFDLPGTVNNADVIRTLSQMDYIFSPVSADRVVLESTLRFAVVLTQQLITTGKAKIKGLYLLWNLVDGREKTELYHVYEQVIEDLQLQVLKTFLPDSKRFRREQSSSHKAVFRSTLFPADKLLVKGSNLDMLSDEILTLINK